MRYVTTGNSKMAEAADSFIEASDASDVLVAAYRRAGELGETIAPSGKRVEGCVYYIRRPGNRVKIGWSSAFRARMQALHVPAEDVLAVESGGMELEVARHRQFEASNLPRLGGLRDDRHARITHCRMPREQQDSPVHARLSAGPR